MVIIFNWFSSTPIGYAVTKILQEGNLSQIKIFLVRNTKYKAIQPLCGMELQRFNKKETLAQTCIAHTDTHSFKTTAILITTNIDKTFFSKNPY